MLLLSNGNEELTRITERIQKDLHFPIREFRMDIEHNGLVLQGIARSYYEKQLVQEAVLRSSALPIASNDIAVCSTPGRRPGPAYREGASVLRS